MTKRVLLVEDEPNIAESLSFLLRRSGFVVSVETDGERGLKSALSSIPDVLVLDVMLPDLDGYEILRQIRADQNANAIPVLMLTAKGQQVDRETALACGANMFMTKPYANADIISAVKSLAG